ncbi:TonB-dependent siderophore receptor [Acetobacter malorum]|uniref:TonB-dependent receptor n=1 Tax=Acetobacter malorum TaxID=178901 RepID=UPI00211B50D8|nr:TonB-dependent receptor [Acetobacter malorum]
MTRVYKAYLTPVSVAGVLFFSAHAWASSSDTLHEENKESPKRENKRHKTGAEAGLPATRVGSVDATDEERLIVTGHGFNTMHDSVGLSRMPQDVMHTPQNINVVPQALMRQQNVKSLDEALRNVPGVTSSIGEGAGGMNGDQFLIRGFQAQNDIYEDGLRDFGVYSRDSFNFDSVSVIKGPSSEVFGNGTTGGAINMVTKTPGLQNRYSSEFTGGSGSYYRGTLDINQKLDSSTAFRLTGMGDEHNVVGRDFIYSHRWGVAPSIAFGLGKRATLVLQYMHQQENSVPDFGVPVVTKPGASYGMPITEYGVKRTNWYGTNNDQNATNDNMETARFTYKVNDHITVYDDLRGGQYYRTFAASKATCDTTCVNNYFNGDPAAALVARSGPVGAGNGTGPGTYMAPLPYEQKSWSVQNVASMVANFNTGFLRHQLVAGFDIERVNDVRSQSTYLNPKPYASLINPNPYVGNLDLVPGDSNPAGLVSLGSLHAKSHSSGYGFDTGLFLFDQIWLTKWLSVKGGFRWDRWQTSYNMTGGDVAKNPDSHFHDVSGVFNPNVSLVATPDEHQTYYFTWASSTTPMGMYVTNGSVPIRPGTNSFASPEKSQLYELGAKYSLFHDRIGATASLFRLDKGNTMNADPVTGEVQGSSDRQRNQGLELSVGGIILPGWNITATYALYDSDTTYSATKANRGKNVQYVPHNQATLWSVYNAFAHTPYNISFGGGVTWRQHVWLNTANTLRAPANLDFSAVISHRFDKHWKVSMNGYNLANRLNYQSLFSNRATPSAGRMFLGEVSFTY